MTRLVILIGFLCFSFLAETQAAVKVVVSIAPQRYFVERIGGQRVEVTVLVPESVSPEIFEPKSSQLKALAEADIYLGIGIPFESLWVPRFRSILPSLRIFDVSRGVARVISDHEGDPHIWLSPSRALLIARNTFIALSSIDPEQGDTYFRNYQSLLYDLTVLDRKLSSILTGLRRPILVYHPVWTYLAEDYGFQQIAIQQNGTDPPPAIFAAILREARRAEIKTLFVQPQTTSPLITTVAKELNAKIVRLDPLSPDWAENLLDVAKIFRETSQ